jgi:hypothetical protein
MGIIRFIRGIRSPFFIPCLMSNEAFEERMLDESES